MDMVLEEQNKNNLFLGKYPDDFLHPPPYTTMSYPAPKSHILFAMTTVATKKISIKADMQMR